MTSFRPNIEMMPPLGPDGYEFAIGDDKVTGRTAAEILPKVRRLLATHGVSAPAEIALAEYMCPRMPRHMAVMLCQGDMPAKPKQVLPREALDNCATYVNRPIVPFDVIQRRIGVCSTCPRHERNWCITCTGAFTQIQQMMKGRRPMLPADRFSGVCGCAKAYEAVVCSVEHEGEPWPDTPETCWRRTEDKENV